MSNIQMVGNSILLLLICFLINSCSNAPLGVNRSQEINDNFQIPNTANNLQEIKNQNRLPVIEIWQELDGSVPIRGKSLYFKLYDDGIVEFDYQLRKENESGKSPRYTYSIEKNSPTKIPEEDFSRFRLFSDELTKSKEIKKEYQAVALTLDVETKLTILLKENDSTKRIIIKDSALDVMDKSLEKKFPKLLVNLIKQIHLMRLKLQENKD